nr:hypothetical protein DWUX_331 [Desulfovibrio diazotrophicus]
MGDRIHTARAGSGPSSGIFFPPQHKICRAVQHGTGRPGEQRRYRSL